MNIAICTDAAVKINSNRKESHKMIWLPYLKTAFIGFKKSFVIGRWVRVWVMKCYFLDYPCYDMKAWWNCSKYDFKMLYRNYAGIKCNCDRILRNPYAKNIYILNGGGERWRGGKQYELKFGQQASTWSQLPIVNAQILRIRSIKLYVKASIKSRSFDDFTADLRASDSVYQIAI